MAVPKFHKFMLPILTLFSDKKEHSVNECVNEVIRYFNLSDQDIRETVPSGTQTLVFNRTYWSLTYLKKSILIESVQRGIYNITERGLALLETNPPEINRNLLSQYEEYNIFSNRTTLDSEENTLEPEEMTPEEKVGTICNKLNEQLCEDLLEIIRQKDPYYFETLVVEVLLKMGYGSFRPNAGTVTQRSQDDGIDGIIDQDKLGLDQVYIQAKRWTSTVGQPEIQKFSGALMGQNANKGIFITTSDFSRQARDFAANISHSIKLINGKELANYMIEYNIGVQSKYTYEIKKIDNDYFEGL